MSGTEYKDISSFSYANSAKRFHTQRVRFCLPKLSVEDAKREYLRTCKYDRYETRDIVFSKEYIKNGMNNIVNVELVYAESAEYTYSRDWFYDEEKKTVYVGTHLVYYNYDGSESYYDDYVDVKEKKYYSKTKHRTSPILLKLERGRDSARKVSGENFKDSEVRIFEAPKVTRNYESTMYPIYVITTKDAHGRYYYSFINGIDGSYRINGDAKKREAKKKLSIVFNTFLQIVISVALSAIFVWLSKIYTLDKFFDLAAKMFDTINFANQNSLIEKILCVIFGILDALLVIIFAAAFLTGFGFAIYNIVKPRLEIKETYGEKYIYDGDSLGNRKFMPSEIVEMHILRPLLAAVIFAAGFGIMYLWNYLLGLFY